MSTKLGEIIDPPQKCCPDLYWIETRKGYWLIWAHSPPTIFPSVLLACFEGFLDFLWAEAAKKIKNKNFWISVSQKNKKIALPKIRRARQKNTERRCIVSQKLSINSVSGRIFIRQLFTHVVSALNRWRWFTFSIFFESVSLTFYKIWSVAILILIYFLLWNSN